MFIRYARFGVAILSGVTASLLMPPAALAQAQENPVVVYGEPQEGLRSERVTYADLDLRQRGHERQLNRRVAGAVKRVCLYESHSARQDIGYDRCADNAWDDARPQIAQAVVRATEIALTGKSSIAATAITISVGR